MHLNSFNMYFYWMHKRISKCYRADREYKKGSCLQDDIGRYFCMTGIRTFVSDEKAEDIETNFYYVVAYHTLTESFFETGIRIHYMHLTGIFLHLVQEFIFSIPVFDNIDTYNNESCAPFPDPNKV